LEPKHQLDQLLLAELLQINPIHPAMDSEIAAHGKGVGNYFRSADETGSRLRPARIVCVDHRLVAAHATTGSFASMTTS
ncbi:MAG: hypothetical protein ABSC25_03650, partial [Roseiarcus sp.]